MITIKSRHGIRLTCRLLPPKEGDVGEIRAILSKTKRELGRFVLEPGCQLGCCGRTYKVLYYRFNSYLKYAILLFSFFLIYFTSYSLHSLNLIFLTALFPIYYSITGVVDWLIGGMVSWLGCFFCSYGLLLPHSLSVLYPYLLPLF